MNPFRNYTAALLLFLSGCTGTNERADTFVPSETYNLNAVKEFSLTRQDVLSPLYLSADNGYLLVTDDNPAHALHILGPADSILCSFGQEGRGPRDLLEVASANLICEGDSLECRIFDSSRKRFVTFRFDTTGKAGGCETEWTTELQFDRVLPLPGGGYIGAAVGDSSNFHMMDEEGRTADRITDRPANPDGIPPYSHSLACTGPLAASAAAPCFARSVIYDGGIDFFTAEGGKIIRKWRFDGSFGMDYDILPQYHNVPAPNEKSRYGYTALYLGGNRLFGLYSGKPVLSEDSQASDHIHVFDLDGGHRTEYRLDRKIFEFSIDEKRGMLYGLATDARGESTVYRYDLNRVSD